MGARDGITSRPIVTGAAAGTGRGVAELFATAGASVVVSDLDGDSAASAAEAIRVYGGTALATSCDVTQVKILPG